MTMAMPDTQPRSARAQMRILIVEDHMLFAESLELVFSVEGYDVRRIPVPENASSPGTLLSSLARLQPRIVLLDLDLGRFGDGVRLISPLARTGINVVVVTASSDRGRWGEAIRCGARTVLSKGQPLNSRAGDGPPDQRGTAGDDLRGAGGPPARVAPAALGAAGDAWPSSRVLTSRESQVLGQLMQGRNVHDIAVLFVVSEATVRTQVKSILAKLKVSSQLAAVGLAHQVGWRPPAG